MFMGPISVLFAALAASIHHTSAATLAVRDAPVARVISASLDSRYTYYPTPSNNKASFLITMPTDGQLLLLEAYGFAATPAADGQWTFHDTSGGNIIGDFVWDGKFEAKLSSQGRRKCNLARRDESDKSLTVGSTFTFADDPNYLTPCSKKGSNDEVWMVCGNNKETGNDEAKCIEWPTYMTTMPPGPTVSSQ